MVWWRGADDGRHSVRPGYATAIYGKWHIGDEPGRYPTDHGFDEWYGIPHSYDECLWPDDPLYDPDRDPMPAVVGTKAVRRRSSN